MSALPPSLAVVPNIPHAHQTDAQLVTERDHWQAEIDTAPGGWGAAVGFAASQRDACDAHLRRRQAKAGGR